MKTKATIAGQKIVVHTQQDGLTGEWEHRITSHVPQGVSREQGGHPTQAAAVYAALAKVGKWIGVGVAIGVLIGLGMSL